MIPGEQERRRPLEIHWSDPEYADRPEIREVLRRTYRIVYRVGDEGIEVLTIFEGHRLFPCGAVPVSADLEDTP